jgi:hypothetical protein
MDVKLAVGICSICGRSEATTMDHIPPRAIFTDPTSDLITVPACSDCNNAASEMDERFKVYLGLHLSSKNPLGLRLFQEGALPSLKHNRKLKRHIISSLRPARLVTNGGIIVGHTSAGLWDSEAHDVVIQRIIRGLYYHHFQGILGEKVQIKVQWLRGISGGIEKIVSQLALKTVCDGQFAYRFGRSNESILNSVWIFQFYNAHWASGHTSDGTF